MPTESDTASTTKLEANLPTGTPIASVSLKPLPGWTAKTTTTKLATPIKSDDGEITEAVSKIDWTASPGGGMGWGIAGLAAGVVALVLGLLAYRRAGQTRA